MGCELVSRVVLLLPPTKGFWTLEALLNLSRKWGRDQVGSYVFFKFIYFFKLEIREFLGNTIIFFLAHLFIRSQYMCLIILLNNSCSKYNMHTFEWKRYMSLSFILTIFNCTTAYFNLGELMQNFMIFWKNTILS
jgi:hypothetical protein